MYYRVHFQPKGAYWCIQFQYLFLFWVTVEKMEKTGDGPTEIAGTLKFATLAEAETFVHRSGIADAYVRACHTRNPRAAIAAGGIPEERHGGVVPLHGHS